MYDYRLFCGRFVRSLKAERELAAGVDGLRIGVPKEFFGTGLNADVEQPIRAALTSPNLRRCICAIGPAPTSR